MTCYIDIEGSASCPVEVGLVLVRDNQIRDSSILYGQISDENDFNRGSRYCHGMSRAFLNSRGDPPEQLCDKVALLLLGCWKPGEIVAFGEDCRKFLARCNVHLPFRNLMLPVWKERDAAPYHKTAFELKSRSALIGFPGSSFCCQSCAHPYPIIARNPVKAKHGAHCAFYDSVELALCDNPALSVN